MTNSVNLEVRKSPARRSRRRADTHHAILKAAARLVADAGYNRVTIEAIAALAGAGKQTIYRWWPSKAALFLELCATSVPGAPRALDAGSVEADLEWFLRQAAKIQTDVVVRAILAGLLAESQGDPELARVFRAHFVLGHRRWLAGVLERGVARGELRPDTDLDLAVDTVIGAVWSRLLLDPAPLDDDVARTLIAQLLRGLSAP